jgi:tetratricopeptide (TPR) repeat protein
MLMATIHAADKDYRGAALDYEKVLAIDPKFSPAMNNYAYLCSENLNQLERAYELAHEARNLLPYDPYTADTLGWILLKRGDYSTAYGLLNESAAKLTDNAEIQYHCGFAAYMLGEEAAARTALSLALKLSQDFAGRSDCLQALSVLNVVPQTADAAVRELLAARVLAKADDVVALKRWAQILERDNQPEKALQSYEKIVALNPKDFNSTMSLSRLDAPKDLAKAYELAKAAYKLSPYDPDALQLLGHLAADTGDFKLATSLYQETIKKRTDDAALYAGLARVAFAIGKVPEAQGALASALKLNMAAPVAAEVKRMAQLVQIASASTPTANDQTLIAEVLRAEPKYLPALAAQAAVAEKAGDVPIAISTHEKILTLYPDFAPSQKQLVLLYAKDLSKASRAYDLAIKVRDFYPNDLALTKAIGVILVGKADYARAVSLLKQCAAVSGNDAEIFFYLGSAQFQLKNLTDSKTSLQRALELKLTGPNAGAARQMLTILK